MQCPQCLQMDHDIHTCPVLSARVRFEEWIEAANAANARQTQPVIAPKAKEESFWSDSDDTMSDGTMDESCDEDDDDMTRDERYRAMIQRQPKDRIITMMLLCPYEIKFDSGMTEWVRKQTKDTVLEFFFMNDEEKKAYYTVHGPMHDRKIAAEKAATEKTAAEKPAAEKAAAEKAVAEKAVAEKAAAEKAAAEKAATEKAAAEKAATEKAAAEKAAAEKAAAEKAAAEKPAAEKAAEEEKAAADEKFRAVLQDESKHRIIMMMFLCPYESKSDRVLTEWLWKQTKDTVIDFFFMNDQEKKAYFTAHVHDIEAPEYTDEHAMYAMEHQHDDYYWRDREVPRSG